MDCKNWKGFWSYVVFFWGFKSVWDLFAWRPNLGLEINYLLLRSCLWFQRAEATRTRFRG